MSEARPDPSEGSLLGSVESDYGGGVLAVLVLLGVDGEAVGAHGEGALGEGAKVGDWVIFVKVAVVGPGHGSI